MVRTELIAKIVELNPELALADVERIVLHVFSTMAKGLGSGARVEIRGFGTFSTRPRDARIARNPRTGAAASVPDRRALHFRASPLLLKAIQPPAR